MFCQRLLDPLFLVCFLFQVIQVLHQQISIYQHEIAAVAADNIAVEVVPFEEPYEVGYPLHTRLIRDLGLTIGELWWFEELATACAAEQRWEFFLSATPLYVANAVGGPTNPIAFF
ncbi:MAG TPA: hypothetical protein VFU63_08135 [Ktedonobacterales bacterium]|nr:hypothetical protein [Ktedonobacterales bacterium]